MPRTIKEVILRTTERRDFKRCPQRWKWAWRDGLVPKQTNDKLWFGIGVHVALAAFYSRPGLKRGPHPARTWEKWCAEQYRTMRIYGDEGEMAYVEARTLGVAMLEGYVRWVKEQGEHEWLKVIAREQTFDVTVKRADGTGFRYVGTFDLVFEDLRSGRVWLGEHKTASQLSTTHLGLDDQAGSYLWVAREVLAAKGVLRDNQKFEGVMYNFLRKQLPDDRKKDAQGYALNVDGTRSKRQPKPLFEREWIWRNDEERVVMANRVLAEEQAMRLYRTGVLPLYKNPTRDCAWDCAFFEMCDLDERGASIEEFKNEMYRRRDPYAEHRKGTE